MACLRVVLAVLAQTLLRRPADAQSLFGFPGHHRGGGYHGGRGLFNDDEFRGRRHNYDPYYQRPTPCPRYEPAQLSRWTEGPAGAASLQAVLPGVRSEHREASLSSDGLRLHVRGWRPLPAGGRACVPRDARLSRDGRYELLEVSAPVPAVLDTSKATLRRTDEGLAVTMPLLAGQGHGGGTAAESAAAASPATPAGQKRPTPAPQRRRVPPAPKVLRPTLPPSDGLVVEEEELPPLEKRPDASEGWFDLRGEFQRY